MRFDEVSKAESGAAWERNEGARQSMLELLSRLRRRVTEINDQAPQMKSEDIYRVGMQLRREVTSGLEEIQRSCQTGCGPLARELADAITKMTTITTRLRQSEREQIDLVQRSLDNPGNGQVLRSFVADLLGISTEIYAFGFFGRPKRGVRLRYYLSKLFRIAPNRMEGFFRVNGVEERMVNKEIDLITETDSTWVEVKALDTDAPKGFLWEKIKTQMRDHLLLMKRLAVGMRRPEDSSSLHLEVRKLRYFFLGRLSQEQSSDLQNEARRLLEEFQNTYGGPRLNVEFTAIPLALP